MNNGSPFSYFDRIYVISAKDHTERRQYITSVLGELDADFSFFDAVMGDQLSERELNEVYDEEEAVRHKTNKRPLSRAEIGCALSHIGVYKEILSNDLNNALIFEDDIAPDHKKMALISEAVNELPRNWDILRLGTFDHRKRAPLPFTLKLLFYYPFVKVFMSDKIDYQYWHLWHLHTRSYSKNLRRAGFHLGNQAYAISHSGAEKFLARHDKIVTPIDDMLSVMGVEDELLSFVTKEKIFRQNRDLTSALEDTRKGFITKRGQDAYEG
jgi:glycosyl transferase family 25